MYAIRSYYESSRPDRGESHEASRYHPASVPAGTLAWPLTPAYGGNYREVYSVHIRGSKASSGSPAPVRTSHRLSPAGGGPYYSSSQPVQFVVKVKQTSRQSVKGFVGPTLR